MEFIRQLTRKFVPEGSNARETATVQYSVFVLIVLICVQACFVVWAATCEPIWVQVINSIEFVFFVIILVLAYYQMVSLSRLLLIIGASLLFGLDTYLDGRSEVIKLYELVVASVIPVFFTNIKLKAALFSLCFIVFVASDMVVGGESGVIGYQQGQSAFYFINTFIIFSVLFVIQEANFRIQLAHERKITENTRQLEEQNDALQKLSNEKNELVENIIHDLKSPINQIKGIISIVNEIDTPEVSDFRMYCKMIESILERESKLVSDLLEVQKMDHKGKILNLTTENLAALVQEITDQQSIYAESKSINLITGLDSTIAMATDASFIRVIIENLISNAIKYSRQDREVTIKLTKEEDSAILSVKDQGPGIKAEEMDLLFRKFKKTTNQPTGGEQSTGLGLAIVKKYADTLGGDAWCESVHGHGATFFVKLPIRHEKA